MKREECLSLLLDHFQQTANLTLISNLLTIHSACHRISSFVQEYDLNDVPANGFRSFVRKCDLYFENMSSLLTKGSKNDEMQGYERLSNAFVKQAKVLQLIREKDESGHKDKTAFHPNDAAIIETLLSFTEEDVKPMYTSPGAFWYEGMTGDMFNRLAHMIVFVNSSWSEKMKLLLNKSYFADRVVHMVQNHDVKSIRDISDLGTIFPFNTLAAIAKYVRGTRAGYHKLKKQTEWTFELDGPDTPVRLQQNKEKGLSNESVNCLLISPNTHVSDTLIMHVHGSGYVAMRPGDHESYLREWSRELGVTVIAPDYAKAPEKPYPCGLQDVLDVYLTVTGSKAQEVIGFKPEKVIITGDSAGGNIGMALVFALNEMKNQGQEVMMPSGICLQYPLSNALSSLPSCGQSCLDTFLPTTLTLTVATSYSETKNKIESLWFRRPGIDVISIRETLERFSCRIKDPLFNLMAYEKWDELADIPLAMQTGEFDPLLDCSIDIGSRWCGSVTFDVMERMPHTFMIFPTARKEAKIVMQRLRQMIGSAGQKKCEKECRRESLSIASLETVFHSLRSIVS